MSHRAKMDVVGVVRGGRRLARHTTRENPLKVKNALRAVEWSADIYIRWAPASQGKAFLITRFLPGVRPHISYMGSVFLDRHLELFWSI